MSEIYVVAVPGTVAHDSLARERARQAELDEPEAITVSGKRLTAFLCSAEELARLRGMPECRGDFTAYRKDRVGRFRKIHPAPTTTRSRRLTLRRALEEGLVRRGLAVIPAPPRRSPLRRDRISPRRNRGH